VGVAPQHWLSLARLVVGAVTWLWLPRPDRASAILPLAILACLLDFADGRLARSRGTENAVGRVLDNACDFAFLAMFFHAASAVRLWIEPSGIALVGWRQHLNALPLLALYLSFGSYAVRAAICLALSRALAPSPVGRAAGVLNWGLALLGASAVSLHWGRPPSLFEPSMAIVVSANVAACMQNVILLVRQLTRATGEGHT
jgi:phosphatidylglycerophosphate synthase